MPNPMTKAWLPCVLHRPDPDHWRPTELMTIPEAAALFYPEGPLTVTSLRTARRDGMLATTMVARRVMTTPDAMRAMGNVTLRPASMSETEDDEKAMAPGQSRMTEAQKELLKRLTPSRGKRAGVRPTD